MAKKITREDVLPQPTIEKIAAEPRLDGFQIVEIISTGSAPTMPIRGVVHKCDATMAQVLIDKGYATLKK
jgi:hypothetical protein